VESVDPAVAVDQSAVMRADGSSVDIDTEAAAQAKNGLQYEAISAVMKSRTAILRSAIGIG
jgi:flagellar basal-body rod protein FlgB